MMTKEKAEEICRIYRRGGITQEDLAQRFDIDQTNVSLIVNRKAWK